MTTDDALKSLHTALIDAGKGYVVAEKDAESPELKRIFQKMSALHEQAHAQVHAILAAKGEKADDAGSFMSTVNKAVVAVRAAVTGLDRRSLSSFASGEERIVADYDKAIEAHAAEVEVVETLRRQRSSLVEMIAEMKSLAV